MLYNKKRGGTRREAPVLLYNKKRDGTRREAPILLIIREGEGRREGGEGKEMRGSAVFCYYKLKNYATHASSEIQYGTILCDRKLESDGKQKSTV